MICAEVIESKTLLTSNLIAGTKRNSVRHTVTRTTLSDLLPVPENSLKEVSLALI